MTNKYPDPKFASGEQWFLPPEGILDGTDFEIAQRYIDGQRADILFYTSDPDLPSDIKARHASIRPQAEARLDGLEARLQNGDADVAGLLTGRMIREISELNRGEHTISGEAHLLGERLRIVGHAHYVPRPLGPELTD